MSANKSSSASTSTQIPAKKQHKASKTGSLPYALNHRPINSHYPKTEKLKDIQWNNLNQPLWRHNQTTPVICGCVCRSRIGFHSHRRCCIKTWPAGARILWSPETVMPERIMDMIAKYALSCSQKSKSNSNVHIILSCKFTQCTI